VLVGLQMRGDVCWPAHGIIADTATSDVLPCCNPASPTCNDTGGGERQRGQACGIGKLAGVGAHAGAIGVQVKRGLSAVLARPGVVQLGATEPGINLQGKEILVMGVQADQDKGIMAHTGAPASPPQSLITDTHLILHRSSEVHQARLANLINSHIHLWLTLHPDRLSILSIALWRWMREEGWRGGVKDRGVQKPCHLKHSRHKPTRALHPSGQHSPAAGVRDLKISSFGTSAGLA